MSKVKLQYKTAAKMSALHAVAACCGHLGLSRDFQLA